jgi:ubiquinol-cytochrome c reductase iron-sulfur subunit
VRYGGTRRDFLYLATIATAGLGALATAWPFINQMNPSADVRAAGGPVEIDPGSLGPGQQIIAVWQSKPIFIVNRPPDALKRLQSASLRSQLRDPDSQALQQPPYAENWHRSAKPQYLVMVGICTHLGCVPKYRPDVNPSDLPGRLARSLFLPLPLDRATTSRAASTKACRHPTTCRCRPTISSTTRRCASARTRPASPSTSAQSSKSEGESALRPPLNLWYSLPRREQWELARRGRGHRLSAVAMVRQMGPFRQMAGIDVGQAPGLSLGPAEPHLGGHEHPLRLGAEQPLYRPRRRADRLAFLTRRVLSRRRQLSRPGRVNSALSSAASRRPATAPAAA